METKTKTIACRLSHRYRSLAADNHLWKALYYSKFVYPRASRLPGIRNLDDRSGNVQLSSKPSKWLDEEHLVAPGKQTDWKSQYRLRHNWSKGNCAVSEIEIAVETRVPPVVVQLHDGVIYIADADGLRAWSAKDDRKLLAHHPVTTRKRRIPVSMGIDMQERQDSMSRLIIGFENGSFDLYTLDKRAGRFYDSYQHPPSTNGVITAVSMTWPYVITMTATQILSIYRFEQGCENAAHDGILTAPTLVHSLRSRTALPPLSTSLRSTTQGFIVAIAYTVPTYLSGWTVGIQEIHFDRDGNLIESRLASAIEAHYRSMSHTVSPMVHHLVGPTPPHVAMSTALELRQIHSKPTSLSYTHPYLLVSLPDNTLTLYLVTSMNESLTISVGSRLWGHTSSVSGAEIGNRGKAVSVSRRGEELRIWELEGGFPSASARRRLASRDLSVQLRPEKRSVAGSSQAGLDIVNTGAEEADDDEGLNLIRGWIGFDDENVVVLKEEGRGRQALMVYDFT